MKLNLGCGSVKIDGYVNIDAEKSCKPDLVHDFTKKPLPFEDGKVDEVLLFHTIEHINKRYHPAILGEIWRVLKPNGTFLISFPEFSRCVENWKNNEGDQKAFWEATIFGRQLYPSDFHVCIMDSHDFSIVLRQHGFKSIVARSEPVEKYNFIICCTKGARQKSYQDVIFEEMSNYKLVKK